jgi:uncharacterized protein YndB with AHSA1/START domain
MIVNTSIILPEEVTTPVVRSVSVPLPVETAFHLFTENIQRWWPLTTHSVFGDEAQGCTLEGWVGGRFYETHHDGREAEWGRVLAWEPPHRLGFSFYPGRTPDSATNVEIILEREGNGTRLTLTHSGWERLDPEIQIIRERYGPGWEQVLHRYIDYVSA